MLIKGEWGIIRKESIGVRVLEKQGVFQTCFSKILNSILSNWTIVADLCRLLWDFNLSFSLFKMRFYKEKPEISPINTDFWLLYRLFSTTNKPSQDGLKIIFGYICLDTSVVLLYQMVITTLTARTQIYVDAIKGQDKFIHFQTGKHWYVFLWCKFLTDPF